MSTLYVPLPSDIASSILAALSAPGAIVDPSLEDLRARLASTLNSASHSPAVQAPSTAVASNTSTFATLALPPRRRVAPLPIRRRYGRFASEPLDAQRWQSIALDETVPDCVHMPLSFPTRTLLATPQQHYAGVFTRDSVASAASSATLYERSFGARPLLSPLQLPTATAPSKRSAPDLSESDSESELARQAKRPKLYIRIPAGMGRAVSQSNEQQESDEESAGDVDNAQAAPAHRRRRRKGPRKKCVRKGDAQPAGIDADIGHVACPAYANCAECSGGAEGAGASEAEVDAPEEQVLSNKAQRGRKPKNVGWKFDPEGGPLLTIRAGQLLGRLLGILTTAGRKDLEDFLQPLPVKHLQAPSTLDAVIERIQYLHVGMKQYDLSYMLALVQLCLHVHSTKHEAVLKLLPKVTGEALVTMFAERGVARKTFLDWVSAGQRLTILCAAGTMFLLPIIAALDLRTYITRTCTEEDIISAANALREVKHGQWLPLVRRLMIPLRHLSQLPIWERNNLNLHFNIPKRNGEDSQSMQYTFSDTKNLDKLFDAIETNYPKLPARSVEWDSPSIGPWLPYPMTDHLLSANTITTPLVLGKAKLPFKKKNRNTWTENQRAKAAMAPLNELHAGGKVKPGKYVEINTSILEDKPLYIRDANGKLLSLALRVPEHIKKAIEDAILHIQAAMPGEFKDEDSRRAMFKYLSCHYTWYARFAENGSGAPADVHPNNLRKEGEGRVNFTQRFPHQSKDILEHRHGFLLLAQAYENFFEFLRPKLAHLLPEDYESLSIYCDALPLGANSPAAPFGGFVINLNVCTWAHLDSGDKLLCLVIPFGNFKGGQLCMYEAGFCWDLQMGDRDVGFTF
ncbi:hypothetical protein B0H17DRAFT_1251658 [Mycena rosella]|uniref:Uncharacterized protein n=1 Tax=Mycena rosella TaxID=1033263 RepID=A0AAD7CX22_MYCRO|nr:hypothetical protein B0H17DRAFT_1251658 [Mycena rosella]